MRNFILISLFATLLSCTDKKDITPQLIDEENKTFFVNGISAIEGKDAIVKSLEDIGFKLDGKISECDLTLVGGSFTYYGSWVANTLTPEQVSILSYGVFDNLPLMSNMKDVVENSHSSYHVFLEWYKSGQIKKCKVELGNSISPEEKDVIEINKRLNSMFPLSRIGQRANGYMTYYNEDGVECYYPNSLYLVIEKK